MALGFRKLAYLLSEAAFSPQVFSKQNIRNLTPISNSRTFSCNPDEDAKTVGQEFQIWCNGGGMFHESARIDPTARIEIGAIVHSESTVGANVCIRSGTIVGPAVTIGKSTTTGFNVALTNCTIGDCCVIHNGVSIGQDGFGFFVNEQGHMVKKPQIGHNVVIGKNCMLCGQVGIAGSVTIGDYVTLAGKVGICDHVCIASKIANIVECNVMQVRLAANSCVTKNITEPGDYAGFPAIPVHEWRKQVALQRKDFRNIKR
ncbi:hypothetical protein BUALT_Bualt03G0072100 [Buddleja alternifolia]|uniref:UDP-3-O-acylglucosamine N-acyltransferase 2, mitochondrial n=1 Tax=Buddleja alternifolia TaxID=168488 RepID=A0AAV6Y048_9LAMI|nr:hypothetical protein BUALT_Bualt03G0072100 [Buddleja alternifolia]